MKEKTCKACKKRFVPVRQFQCVCNNWECAAKHIENLKRKKEALDAKTKRKVYQDTKNKLKSLTELANDAQIYVNKYCRLRDDKLGCISCDKPATWNGQWHASHYKSRGANTALRFNLWNIHKSCSVCNNYLSGSIGTYRPRLIEKIKLNKVE